MYAVRSGCRRNATRERRAAAFGRADDYYSKMPKNGWTPAASRLPREHEAHGRSPDGGGGKPLAALCGGTPSGHPGHLLRHRGAKLCFGFAAGRSGTGGIFATRPPVPSRHLNPDMPKGLGGQSGELPVHTLRHDHALMLSWSPAVGSTCGRGIHGVYPYYGPSKIGSEEECSV